MYNFTQLTESLQGHVDELGPGAGHRRFVDEVYEAVGIRVRDEASGELVESVGENGQRRLAANRCRPNEFRFSTLAEAIGGRNFLESFNPQNQSGRSDSLELIEAGPGIDPTAFLNINTFSAAVGGLIEAKILEDFENPKFIGDQLFETVPTNKNGERIIGTAGFGADEGDTKRNPGDPHARAQIEEVWVETPELDERAMAVEVTQEAVFYDLTNQVLDRAGEIGAHLGYVRERHQLRLFAGITNSYRRNGTAYNTYHSEGAGAPWVNRLSNPLGDDGSFRNVDKARELFEDMVHLETGKEILVDPTTIIHMPRKQSNWHFVLNSTEQRQGDGGGGTTLATPPPSTNANYTLLESTILRNLIRDELTSGNKTQAQEFWFIGQPKKCFKWMEAWPIRVRQASANEFVMLDRGLIAAYFGNYRGIGAVKNPQYMVQCTN